MVIEASVGRPPLNRCFYAFTGDLSALEFPAELVRILS